MGGWSLVSANEMHEAQAKEFLDFLASMYGRDFARAGGRGGGQAGARGRRLDRPGLPDLRCRAHPEAAVRPGARAPLSDEGPGSGDERPAGRWRTGSETGTRAGPGAAGCKDGTSLHDGIPPNARPAFHSHVSELGIFSAEAFGVAPSSPAESDSRRGGSADYWTFPPHLEVVFAEAERLPPEGQAVAAWTEASEQESHPTRARHRLRDGQLLVGPSGKPPPAVRLTRGSSSTISPPARSSTRWTSGSDCRTSGAGARRRGDHRPQERRPLLHALPPLARATAPRVAAARRAGRRGARRTFPRRPPQGARIRHGGAGGACTFYAPRIGPPPRSCPIRRTRTSTAPPPAASCRSPPPAGDGGVPARAGGSWPAATSGGSTPPNIPPGRRALRSATWRARRPRLFRRAVLGSRALAGRARGGDREGLARFRGWARRSTSRPSLREGRAGDRRRDRRRAGAARRAAGIRAELEGVYEATLDPPVPAAFRPLRGGARVPARRVSAGYQAFAAPADRRDRRHGRSRARVRPERARHLERP